jgi:hypothetical protein
MAAAARSDASIGTVRPYSSARRKTRHPTNNREKPYVAPQVEGHVQRLHAGSHHVRSFSIIVGGPMSQIGVQLTDSHNVVEYANRRVLNRRVQGNDKDEKRGAMHP